MQTILSMNDSEARYLNWTFLFGLAIGKIWFLPDKLSLKFVRILEYNNFDFDWLRQLLTQLFPTNCGSTRVFSLASHNSFLFQRLLRWLDIEINSNNGRSMLKQVAVVEVSSYQMELPGKFCPKVGWSPYQCCGCDTHNLAWLINALAKSVV